MKIRTFVEWISTVDKGEKGEKTVADPEAEIGRRKVLV